MIDLKQFFTDQKPKCGEIEIINDDVVITFVNKPLEYNKFEMIIPAEFVSERYFFISYLIKGVRRMNEYVTPLIETIGEDGDDVLCYVNQIYIDGKEHTLIVQSKENKKYSGIKLYVNTKAPFVEVIIKKFISCNVENLPVRFGGCNVKKIKNGFTTVDLGNLYNASVINEPSFSDSGYGMPEGPWNCYGIPFLFSINGLNVIVPPPAPPENDDVISNFGISAKRGVCRPTSRDSLTEIPIGKKAKEICFALVAGKDLFQRWGYYDRDPSVERDTTGEVKMPYYFCDVERFMIEIVYRSGMRDTVFPFNIRTGSFSVCGETGIYAAGCSGEEIDRIIIHNRCPETDISVAAVTLNNSDVLFSQEIVFHKSEIADISIRDSFVRIDGNNIVIDSGSLCLTVDLFENLNIKSVNSSYTGCTFNGNLLKVLLSEKDECEKLRVENAIIQNSGKSAGLYLCGTDIDAVLNISVEEQETIVLSCEIKNNGSSKKIFSAELISFKNLVYTSQEKTFFMFPRYRNAVGGYEAVFSEETSPTFPMQFFDTFCSDKSGGIGILTRERGTLVRKYNLSKSSSGISCSVEYPEMYTCVDPGCSVTLSDTVIYSHSGDWHKTFDKYRLWLKSWYKPYKSQNKEWYRSLYWLVSEITDFYEDDSFYRNPPWYNPETGEYNFIKIMKEIKSLYGFYPDILHMWGWAYDEKNGHQLWGNFDDEDYAKLGGIDNFKRALNDCTAKTGAQISLYLNPTLLSPEYEVSKKYIPDFLSKNARGGNTVVEGAYRMCHADEAWRKYAIEMYRRVAEKTDVPILYVDEFSLNSVCHCYASGHGHEIPSNLLLTDRKFISELKDTIDENKILYCEYPVADVNACYIDCNITYYINRYLNENIIGKNWGCENDDRTYVTDLYRFAFPGIVQLVLPMALRNSTWQPLKSIFYNAEAVYDSFWDAEESRARFFMMKSFALKKKYADIFSSENAETALETELDGVYANRFIKGDTTVYTLYNDSHSTKRGMVIRIPYGNGMEICDEWNECDAKTVREGDEIYIYAEVDSQDVGCIVIKMKGDI